MKVLLIGGSKVNKLVTAASDRFKATLEIEGIEFISEIDDYFDRGGTFDRVIVAGPGYNYAYDNGEIRRNIDEFIKSVRDRLKRFNIVIVTETEETGAQLVEATLDISGNSAIVFLDKARGEKFSSSFLNNLIITDLANFPSKFKVLDIGFLQELDQQTSDAIIDADEIDWSTAREIEQAEYTVPKAKEVDMEMEGLSEDEQYIEDETPVGVQDDFGIPDSFGEIESIDWGFNEESTQKFSEELDEMTSDDFGDVSFNDEFGDVSFNDEFSEDDSKLDEETNTEEEEAGYFPEGDFSEFDKIFNESSEETEDIRENEQFSSDWGDDNWDSESADAFENSEYSEELGDEAQIHDTFDNELNSNSFDITSNFDTGIEEAIEVDEFEQSDTAGDIEDIEKLFEDEAEPDDTTTVEDELEKRLSEEVEIPVEANTEVPKKGKLMPKRNKDKQVDEQKKASKLKLKNNKNNIPDVEAMYEDIDGESNIVSGTELNTARNISGIKGAGIKKRTNKKQPMNQQMSNYDILKLKLDGYKKRGNLLVVTGAANTGKTTVAANLANLVCKLGYQVLIVDMDTRGKGMAYINLDSYEAVHSQRNDESTLKLALNNSGDRFSRYATIVRPGMHLLSTGLAYDAQDAKAVITRANLTKFIHQAQNLYQLIIVDIGFVDATQNFTEFTLAADEIVIVSEVNTHGMVQLLLEMSNIPDESENISDVVFENSKLLLNKEDGMERLFGKKVLNTGQLLGALDNKLTELIGFSIDKRLSDLDVCGLLKYNKSFEEYWYNKAYLSDTQDGEAIFLEILQRILDIN